MASCLAILRDRSLKASIYSHRDASGRLLGRFSVRQLTRRSSGSIPVCRKKLYCASAQFCPGLGCQPCSTGIRVGSGLGPSHLLLLGLRDEQSNSAHRSSLRAHASNTSGPHEDKHASLKQAVAPFLDLLRLVGLHRREACGGSTSPASSSTSSHAQGLGPDVKLTSSAHNVELSSPRVAEGPGEVSTSTGARLTSSASATAQPSCSSPSSSACFSSSPPLGSSFATGPTTSACPPSSAKSPATTANSSAPAGNPSSAPAGPPTQTSENPNKAPPPPDNGWGKSAMWQALISLWKSILAAWAWFWTDAPITRALHVVALLLQLAFLAFLLRAGGLPLRGSSGGQWAASPSPGSASAAVSVPYSSFLEHVHANEVARVEVDGVHLTFSLRGVARGGSVVKGPGSVSSTDVHSAFSGSPVGSQPKSEASRGQVSETSSPASGSDSWVQFPLPSTPWDKSASLTEGSMARWGGAGTRRASNQGVESVSNVAGLVGASAVQGRGATAAGVAHWAVLSTVRPTDLATPYNVMMANGVQFGAPDNRLTKRMASLSIALVYVGLLAGLLGRLPYKFGQPGPQGRAKRRGVNSRGLPGLGERSGAVGRGVSPSAPVMFADVAGVDEAKEELEEVVDFLRSPERYARLGARPPCGVLLVGQPGTGKTLLARAVAGEAEAPFFSCCASEFVELYVGMGASRVRDLFQRAKKEAPSIIFIDEIDAVAKGRDSRWRSAGNDEREQTLNQLLTELDGFDSNCQVIVLAATNRADVLDPALRRPGRFDRIVSVEPPDRYGREAILTVHIQKKGLPLAPDIDIAQIAAATTGFCGADLANLVNEAALLAARSKKLVVGKEEFAAAVERSIAGVEKKRSALHVSEKGVVARHEVGHAIAGTAVARLLPGAPTVQKLTIGLRSGGILGFTYTPPSHEDRHLRFCDELLGNLVTLLGGRAAEMVAFNGRVSTGASDDILRATDLAYKAIAVYGLNPAVGPISVSTLTAGGLDQSGGPMSWGKEGGAVAALVDTEVKGLLEAALETAQGVVAANRTVLDGLGTLLEVEERVEGEALVHWLGCVEVPPELPAFLHRFNLQMSSPKPASSLPRIRGLFTAS